MLEFFRKYSAFAFIVLIILFIGLVFMVDGVGKSGMGSGPKLMSLNGRAYTHSEVEREGADYLNMLFGLRDAGHVGDGQLVGPYMFAVANFNQRMRSAADAPSFLANRLVLQDLAEKYGVIPSQELIEKTITEKLFLNSEQKFDQAGYDKFIERRVKRYGMGVKDLNTLVGEILSVEKLMGIVGEGYMMDESLLRRNAHIIEQTMSYEQFSFPMDKIKDTITVTEEEIKAYWEENENRYLTDPQVKVEYVITDAGIAKLQADHKKAEIEKAKAEGKTEEEIAKLDTTLPDDQKTDLINAAAMKVDNLFVQTQNDGGGKFFEKNAKELGLEVKTTEFFTAASAPADFKTPSQSGTPASIATQLSLDPDSMDSVSDFFTLGEGRYLIFRALERIEAQPLAFEDAKDKAKADLISQKLSESMETQTEGLRNQLVEAAKAGKAIEKAKEMGMEYAKRENLKINDRIDGEVEAAQIFIGATEVKVNEFSEPMVQEISKRVTFVRPLERSFIETEESKALVSSQVENSGKSLDYIVFSNWFRNELELAQFERFASSN